MSRLELNSLLGSVFDDDDDAGQDGDALLAAMGGAPEPPTNGATPRLVLGIVKAFIGSGILFLPKAYANGGWALSTASLIVFALLTKVCIDRLVECRAVLSPGVTYSGVGRAAAGRAGALAVDVSLVLSQCGFCCVYISFVARNVLQLLNSGSGGCWVPASSLWILILLELPLLAPLTWVRRLHSFGPSNIIADVLIGCGLLAVLIYSAVGMATKTPLGPGGHLDLPYIGSGWPIMVGTAVYAFEGVGMVLPMINALPRSARAGFPAILNVTLAGVAAAYIIVGLVPYTYLAGYAGTPVQDAITLNLPRTWWSYAVTGGYCVALLLSYPYMMFPAMAIMEGAALPYMFPKAAAAAAAVAEEMRVREGGGMSGSGLVATSSTSTSVDIALGSSGRTSPRAKWAKNAFRTSIVGITLLVSYVGASQLDNFVSLIGAFACTPIAFILPALFHARLFGGEQLQTEGGGGVGEGSGSDSGSTEGAAVSLRGGGVAVNDVRHDGEQAPPRASKWVLASDWAIVLVGTGIMAFSTYECVAGWHSSTVDPCPNPVT